VHRDHEVHLHRPFELLVAGAEESLYADSHRPHVVDEHVDPSVLVDRARDQLRGSIRCGQVARHAADSIDVVEGLHRAGAGDDARPLGGEGSGNR
jgi:hypothetical protein